MQHLKPIHPSKAPAPGIGSSLAIATLFAFSCSGSRDVVSLEPFEVTLSRTVTWKDNQPRFDSTLPGFHFVGGVGEVRIRPRSTILPEKLIFAIETSPGMRPNLESFNVESPDSVVDSVPFRGPTRVSQKNGKGEIGRLANEAYFLFESTENEIRVTFQPRAMSLLRKECTIRWVDWYRR